MPLPPQGRVEASLSRAKRSREGQKGGEKKKKKKRK